MKTIKLEINEHEAATMRDALNDAAIALRTNHMTGVVMSEKDFLASDISTGRRNHYATLKARAEQLAEFVRLA